MKFKSAIIGGALLLGSAGVASAAVVEGDLNLRTGPSTSYSIIDTMPAGANVDILSCTGSWCRVAFRGIEGYASASYLGGGGGGAVYAAAPPVVVAPPVVGFSIGFGGWRHHGWHHHGWHRGWHHGWRHNHWR